MRRVAATTLWHVVLKVPQGSRINYQIEVRRGEHVERFNDPLNPKHSHSPFGAISVCFTFGYTTPEWTAPDSDAAPGELTELLVKSHALQRDCRVTLYVPARFRRDAAYPLLVVHDGGEFLQYAAAKVVLDNLTHRGEIAPWGSARRVRQLSSARPLPYQRTSSASADGVPTGTEPIRPRPPWRQFWGDCRIVDGLLLGTHLRITRTHVRVFCVCRRGN